MKVHPKIKSIQKLLIQIPNGTKAKVYKIYKDKLLENGFEGKALVNDSKRELLASSIFEVEDDLEHRLPNHPTVLLLNDARNLLYDDLNWNEYKK